jgi:DNA-binding transcriptional LysR family regulator
VFVVPEPRVESVLLAVAAGTGIAILPAAAADRYAIPGVGFLPLEDGDHAFESAVLTHPDADDAPTAVFLRALAARTATQERFTRESRQPALRLAS